jgi:phenylalanyl-tRNA synthetase beta chain
MDMKLTDLQNGIIEVEVPTNKPDVKRQADVVEEICRIYGFDQIAIPDQLRIAIQDTGRSLFPVRKQLSEWLTANGLNEIMSLSLVRSAPCIQSGLWKEDELVYIHNTSNIQLDIMRPSIVLGGLESLQFNFNRQQTDLAFYEIGKEYKRSNEKIIENNMLGIWLTGSVQAAHWIRPKPVAQDFFQLKSYVEGIFQLLNIENYKTEELKDHPMFDFAVNYKLNKNQQGVIAGKLAHSICERYDIKKEIWFAALNLDLLAGSMNKQPVMFREFSKFPQIRRDLALVIDAATPFELLKGLAAKHAGELLKDIQLFDVYENTEQLGVGKKSYALSFTFENTDRQMSSGEIEQLMDRLIRLYEKETGAIIRK